MLCLSVHTLANWRSQDKGPPYRKLGRAVRYELGEIEEWLMISKDRETPPREWLPRDQK